ncbi:MAG TPA: hypothetical protein VIK33_20440 [Anaerolineae bacterium]
MKELLWVRLGGIVLIVVLMASCSAAPTPEPDLVATRVFIEQAAAATLTAAAPPPSPTVANTPAPLADTPPPPTDAPIRPTATLSVFANVPVDGDNGDLLGEVVIPGSVPPAPDPLVFTTQIVFRVLAHDPQAGNDDGAGIDSVDFTILQINSDGSEEVVHTRTERNAGYCAFGGGEPECDVWVFADHANTWPSGQPVQNGPYRAEMSIHPQDPNRQGASWRFTFDVQIP